MTGRARGACRNDSGIDQGNAGRGRGRGGCRRGLNAGQGMRRGSGFGFGSLRSTQPVNQEGASTNNQAVQSQNSREKSRTRLDAPDNKN
ncbi:MAG: hypothetical protein CR981_04695 [Proteobacteria bacterium]|nr:MAG: hypothetical protein CR981_04695 [Pseudomonadota bacterium]